MRKIIGIVTLSCIFIAVSCKKKDDSPAQKPLLMTVNVSGHYFSQVLGGVIFISDMQGKTLSDTFCLNDGTYKFYGRAGASVPSLMEVTTVKADPYWHSFSIIIETFTCISSSEWTLLGSRADTVGQAFPVYLNIPDHNDAILISSSGYSNLTSTLEQIPIPLYKTPDDIYFGIPTSAGMKYKWFSGIKAGSRDTFDLSNLLVPEKRTISFPSPVQYYECRVQGYTGTDFSSPIPYMIDEILGNGIIASSVDAYYPPSRFQGFHTDLMVVETWASNQSWFYQVDGQIPAAFRKVNAQVNSFTSTKRSLKLNASGVMDAVSGTWKYLSPYQGLVEWTVYGPDTATSLQLPDVAPSLNQMFPWFSRDSMNFTNVQLIDMVNCQGYQQVIKRLFDPSNPSAFERQEASILSEAPAGK